MKILAIGNSFSEDATAYLHQMATADQVEVKVVNLFIGGCSLERHWNNVIAEEAGYDYQLNGVSTGKKISIKEALLEDSWDVVTLQQCSGFSGLEETYMPYIENLSAYVTELAPRATQMIHETWAYEVDSTHEDFHYYENSQSKMYQALRSAYISISKQLSLPIIPCGDVIQELRSLPSFDYTKGGMSLCRDGFHMHMLYGRYALGLIWYKVLMNGNIKNNQFRLGVKDGLIPDEALVSEIKCFVEDYFTHQENGRRI